MRDTKWPSKESGSPVRMITTGIYKNIKNCCFISQKNWNKPSPWISKNQLLLRLVSTAYD